MTQCNRGIIFGTLQFAINDYEITIKEKHDHGPDHELQKWATFCKSRSQEKLYNFSRKTIQFLVIANCRNGPLSADSISRKTMQFFEKTIQFLVIAVCSRTAPDSLEK